MWGISVRRPLLFGVIFSLVLFGSLRANAGEPGERAHPADISWHALADYEKAIIDRMAADFFEKSLRLSQTRQIEAATPAIYRSLSPHGQAQFRAERRRLWRNMPDRRRQALRGVTRPDFDNLAEIQKLPFRQNAVNLLNASGAINANALTAALRREI